MQYISHYESLLGKLLLSADDMGLIGIWFEEQKYFAQGLKEPYEEKELPVFEDTKRWLTIYFSGKEPDFTVPFHFIGTNFQKAVWEILCSIPYGKNHDLRGNCKTDCPAKRYSPYVCPGRGRSCRA